MTPRADRGDWADWGRLRRAASAPRHRRAWRRALHRHRRLLVAGLLAAASGATVQALTPESTATHRVVVAARDLGAGVTLTASDLSVTAWPVPAPVRAEVAEVVGRVLASPLRAGEPVTDVRLVGPGLLIGQPAGTRAVTVRVGDPASVLMIRPGDRIDVLTMDDAGSAGTSSAGTSSSGTSSSGTSSSGTGSFGTGSTGSSSSGSSSAVVVENALVLAVPGAGEGTQPLPGGAGGSGLGGLSGIAGSAGAGSATGPLTTGALSGGLPEGVVVVAIDRAAARRVAAVGTDRPITIAVRSGT